jgi:hypothetical protein
VACEDSYITQAQIFVTNVLNTWDQERARRVTLVKGKRNAYRIFTETAKRKRPPGRPERRWVTNTPDFKPRNSSERIHLARERDKWRAVVRTIMNLRGQ